MTLITPEQREQLLLNGHDINREQDLFPVVKLFMTDDTGCWLLTQLDPDSPDNAYGLCDLGLGYAELGYVAVSDLESFAGKHGAPVVREEGFIPQYPISVYTRAARAAGHITFEEHLLSIAAKEMAAIQRRLERWIP